PPPIPFTFLKSSALLNGRASIIRWAITGPIPGMFSSSVCDAVLTSSFVSGIEETKSAVVGSVGATEASDEVDERGSVAGLELVSADELTVAGVISGRKNLSNGSTPFSLSGSL